MIRIFTRGSIANGVIGLSMFPLPRCDIAAGQ